MSKRAVLYARVSSDDSKKDGRNLQSQIDMCREYSLERGWTIVAELREDDRGASGAAFDLPSLNKALEMARAGEFDLLITRELDRFARGLAKQLIVEQEFKHNGVVIEYVLGDYDDTPEGQLMKHVRAIIAEYEREKINERMTRARLNLVKNGNTMAHGQPPYGYRIEQRDGKSVFVIDENEAQIIRLIFDLYTQGLNRTEIVDKLNTMGVETWQDKNGIRCKQRPNRRWSDSTICKILSNETYCGTWHYGKKTKVNGKRVFRPREEWLPVEVPAIVSRATWATVQEKRKLNKKRAKRNRKYKYLLSNYITCGHCGLSINGNARRPHKTQYFYYRCNGRDKRTVRNCDIPVFRVELVDAAVWGWIREVMSDHTKLQEELESRWAEQEKENVPLRERLVIVDGLIADNQAQLARALDLYLSGDFEQDILVERKARLETTLGALERERQDLVATLDARVMTSEEVQTIEEFTLEVEEAFALIDDEDFDAKRAMLDRLGIEVRLAAENGEKVAYVSSPVLGAQVLSVISKPSKTAAPTPTAHPGHPAGAG